MSLIGGSSPNKLTSTPDSLNFKVSGVFSFYSLFESV